MHATAVVLGSSGVLIRGASSAGKTTSALALIDHYAARSRFAALVADDRVLLQAVAGRVIARPPANLAGLIEVRGAGILAVDHEPAAVLRLVIDLMPASELSRIPDPGETRAELLGIALPRLPASPGPSFVALVCIALHALSQSCS